ncbi:30S ribosomal protein S14 [Candidatus Woesearchaeota archaeon]|nr:30S ribosomal protein S14 [Candidatus Woesearchaeota archaeon]
MTTSDHKKAFTQLNAKPVKKAKFIKFNQPKKRSCGLTTKRCRNCGRHRGLISKYNVMLCRQCFREIGPSIGFKKYS